MTSFAPDDCAARLPANDVVQEYVFAEFKPVQRKLDDLWVQVTLDFPPGILTLAAPQPVASPLTVPLTKSALDTFGGVPVSRVFDKDLSDLHNPVVPLVRLDDIEPLLNKRSGQVDYAGGSAHVDLDDNAVADLVAGRDTIVQGRQRGGRTVFLRLSRPAPVSTADPLQRKYHIGSAEDFIRNPYIAADDGTRIKLRLSGQQLLALHNDGQTSLRVHGRQVTLVAGDGEPVVEAFSSTGVSAVTDAGQPLLSDDTGEDGQAAESVPGVTGKPDPTPLGQLQLALYMPWRHTWTLTGYSRGDLLHTLDLAAQEEVTIEVSSWDRYKNTYEESAESTFEQSRDFTQTDKDSHAVVRDMTNGSSFGISIGGQVGYNMPGGFNVTGTNSEDARANLNNSSKFSFDSMSESVTKSSMKLRLERQTKVGETSEIGTEDKTTRRVRNPNLCHTLQLNYYEILAHYDIEIAFNAAEARLCVLVPTKGIAVDDFTYANVRYYESVLKRVLLVPELASGFDAAHRLVAQDKLCEARARVGKCSAAENLSTADDAAWTKIIDQLNDVVTRFGLVVSAPAPSYRTDVGQSAHIELATVSLVCWNLIIDDPTNFERWFYLQRARQIEPVLFITLALLKASKDGGTLLGRVDVQHAIDAIAEVPDLAALSAGTLRQDQDKLFRMLKAYFRLSQDFSYLGVPEGAYALNDAGLMAAISTLRDMVQTLGDTQTAQQAEDVMASNQAAALAEQAANDTANDLEAVDALITHLNAYVNYYRASIFQLMPWPEAFEQILGLYYPTVERQVLGFSGDFLALPVNLEFSLAAKQFFDEMVTNNPELTSMSNTQPVSLPTSGVRLENRLGDCSGCEEYIEQLRRLDLMTKHAEMVAKREIAKQQRLEVRRYRRRLAADDLGDPVTRQPTLRIEQSPSDDGASPQNPPPPVGAGPGAAPGPVPGD